MRLFGWIREVMELGRDLMLVGKVKETCDERLVVSV